MGEEISNTMNLDLNLGPNPELTNNVTVHLAHWGNGSSERQSESLPRLRVSNRSCYRQMINILPVLAETHSPAIELSLLMINSANGPDLPSCDGSIHGGERVKEDSKKCENGNGVMEEDDVQEDKRDIEKNVDSDGSFFDCYICLDLSKDPVVTNCGHLYCWSCLYQWLQVSEAKECPVCKGKVSVKTLTPIYGRGKNKRDREEVSDTKIPLRPPARRMESLRNTLHRSGYIPTEMIRHLQDRLERESSTGEIRTRPFLNRFMSSRGVRAEHNQSSATLVATPLVAAPLDDVNNDIDNTEVENRNTSLSRLLDVRRQWHALRDGRMSPSSSVLSSAERLVDSYLRTHNQEQSNVAPVGIEDGDVINSESQLDTTAVEADSMLTVSTSSSVRRHENGSRVSDVDNADSLPLRRRRRLAYNDF